MQDTKNPTGNSCIHYEENDEEYSWIERELEEKLWDLFDIAKIKKASI